MEEYIFIHDEHILFMHEYNATCFFLDRYYMPLIHLWIATVNLGL